MNEPTLQDALSNYPKGLRRTKANQIRNVLREYHEYVEREFPISGFGQASINNFVVRATRGLSK